jgi:hypothetical protein
MQAVSESETTQATVWTPVKVAPGPEMAALAPFLPNCTWKGTVYANMQGPGSPEMVAVGGAEGRWIMGGLWRVYDCFQDQFAQGEKLLTWELHLVVGWDLLAQEYRAVLVDNNGISTLMRGVIEGTRFVMTPVGEVMAAGQRATMRFTWDAADPHAIYWRSEASIGGSPWMLIEDYVMTPVA